MSKELETQRVQIDQNGTNDSAIISTYPHQCDSGRSRKTDRSANEFKVLELPFQKKIQEADLEREDFSRSTLPIPNIPLSIRNKPTMTKSTFQETSLAEKIPSPSNSPILSPETIHVLENAEKLVENAQKQIIEINHNILFHETNPEIHESQPTIDEDLLHLRQIVASRFQQVNNPSKVHNASDHKTFANSVQQVPEKEITNTPRLLKLITMLPEKYYLETKDEESCCRTIPFYVKRKLLSTDSIPNRSNASDKVRNESTNKNEKAAQTDENENKSEYSTFQIQTGPRVIIKRSLQVQNMERLHISPEPSVNEPTNVGIYNFQHETSSEKSDATQDDIIIEDDHEDDAFLEGRNAEKKQIFRKSIVIKKPDESRLSFKKDSSKTVEKLSETNTFSKEEDELIFQSPRETTTANSTKSPKECNIENAKAKVLSEFLISLENDLDFSITSNKVQHSEEIKTNFETQDSREKPKFEKIEDNSVKAPTNHEMKNTVSKKEKLRNKAAIIGNERVNLKYKNILRGCNPAMSKSFFQLDKKSKDSDIEIDDINLEKPSVVDLETVLKRNDEKINSIVYDTDTLFKTISSKFESYSNVINQENKKVNQSVEFASFKESKPHDKNEESVDFELIKSSVDKCCLQKESDLKFDHQSDKMLDHIISGTNKFTKFIVARSEINDSVINHESASNSQSVNLSSASLSLMSSTKNPISQKLLSSGTKKESSSVSSNDQSANALKDFSIKNSSEEVKSELSILSSERSSRNASEEKREKKNDKIDEGKSIKILSMESSRFDNFEKREDTEFSKNVKDQLSNSEEIDSNCKDFPLKPHLHSNNSSNIHNINYSGPSLQIKEKDFSEMEIFSHIFESLRHSSAAMKRFITCLFGETEARIENEIIGILRETAVHPTIINKFLLILQKRDKNSQLPMFTTNIGLFLNLSDDSRDSFMLKKQFEDLLEGRSKTVSLNTGGDEKLIDDNRSDENEKNDKKFSQIRLELDVTTKDKRDIYDDATLVVSQEKVDLTKPQEGNKELFVEKLNGVFASEIQSKVETVLNGSNTKEVINESDKNRSDSSLQKSEGKTENSNEVEIHSGSSLDIRLIESGLSINESPEKIDYSQNFTDTSSTSKDCKSLESHVSLKLSDSFMNKKEDNKETVTERNDELEIQRKIDDLLDKEKLVAQSVEKSIKTEIDNLTKEKSSEESVRRKPLIRGKTFVIKKNSNLDLETKVPEISCSNLHSSMSDSQKESNFRMPSGASGSSGKNVESSSETYSEGEVYFPSSCSYSLGEIRLSQQEKLRLEKTSQDTNSSKTVFSSRRQNSGSSSCVSNSLTRSLGEVFDSLS